jgi:hypothetical protein
VPPVLLRAELDSALLISVGSLDDWVTEWDEDEDIRSRGDEDL